MVRLSDVVPAQRETLVSLDCPDMPPPDIQPARPLQECRVALISSAGLMQRGTDNIAGNFPGYRTITPDTSDANVLMNHLSVNFDRTGFAEDINCVFPRAQLNALAAQNIIGSAADNHYSFMGATPPDQMVDHVHQLTNELNNQGVNTVCLLPV
ncbi:MAG: hypothetical protein AAF404_03970 [Pseudomonadota bacterium]